MYYYYEHHLTDRSPCWAAASKAIQQDVINTIGGKSGERESIVVDTFAEKHVFSPPPSSPRNVNIKWDKYWTAFSFSFLCTWRAVNIQFFRHSLAQNTYQSKIRWSVSMNKRVMFTQMQSQYFSTYHIPSSIRMRGASSTYLVQMSMALILKWS